MAIQRLPEPAVRAIGSCQALTESCSLVKELIDNALDANATSVTVDISANTLDVVQVKDNGHGIAPEDRDAMAVRYSTSKISSLRELESLGGRSLGFRGVALSAACQMAGRMVITTRIEGESVAEACWVDGNGSIENRECASHPVGTTVRISDFLKRVPVRRENALRNSTKTLARIQRTLQAYAFARPSVRFCLKVLKSGKCNWLYAPKKRPTQQLDLSLIIGKDAASQCIRHSYPPPAQGGGEGSNGDSHGTYSIEAFIPRLDADTSKVTGKGQFISIDSRPVSCSRGILKQISSLYKSYLQSASQGRVAGKLIDPFICMNIICPLGSYDVNVEPAKDDVQFGDPSVVLSIVEKFFQSVYGELKLQAMERQTPGPRSRGTEFDVLLGRKGHQTKQNEDDIARNTCAETADDDGLSEMLTGGPNDSITTNSNTRGTASNHSDTGPGNPSEINSPDPATIQSAWKFTMYRDGDEGSDEDGGDISLGSGAGGAAPTEVRGMEKNSRTAALDPWTIAKMNSPARRVQPSGYSSELDSPNAQLLTPKRSPQRTPLVSSKFRRFSGQEGLDREATYAAGVYSPPQSPRFISSPSTSRRFTAINERGKLLGAGSLDTWLQGPHQQLRISARGNSPDMIQAADPPQSSTRRRARIAGSLAPNTPLMSGAESFIEKTSPIEPVLTTVPTSPGVGEPLDHRRQRLETVKQNQEISEATATRREPNNKGTCPTPSPHGNRYQAARTALASTSVTPSPFENEDPRNYPIRLAQPDHSGMTMPPPGQAARVKAAILPLERIPAVFRVHNLSIVVSTSLESIERVERAVALSDAYVASGKVSYTFPSDPRGMSEIEASLKKLTGGMCQDETGDKVDLHIDLNMLMRNDIDA